MTRSLLGTRVLLAIVLWAIATPLVMCPLAVVTLDS